MDDTKTIIDPTSQDSLEDQVIPEEVAEETVNDQTQDFLNLESLVKTYVEKIDKLQKEIHEKTEMVNDALLAVYEIPKDYVDFFCKIRRYEPSREQKSVLMNRNISKAEFGVKKMELAKC